MADNAKCSLVYWNTPLKVWQAPAPGLHLVRMGRRKWQEAAGRRGCDLLPGDNAGCAPNPLLRSRGSSAAATMWLLQSAAWPQLRSR